VQPLKTSRDTSSSNSPVVPSRKLSDKPKRLHKKEFAKTAEKLEKSDESNLPDT
jgi:hypothetical protein